MFRWRSRESWSVNGYYMGSGLDDYPRIDKNEVSKYHLDIHVWILFFMENLLILAKQFDSYEVVQKISLFKQNVEINLQIFQDPKDLIYKDVFKLKQTFTQHLQRVDKTGVYANLVNLTESLYRIFYKKELLFSKHLGYVNMFPLFFGYVKKEHLIESLKFISNPNIVASKYGVRSLSMQDNYFGQHENYWRGPIWININYLFLKGLKQHYADLDFVNVIQQTLKQGLVKNVCDNFQNNGWFYEQYDPITGQGMMNHPFNGWTSLIVLLMQQD